MHVCTAKAWQDKGRERWHLGCISVLRLNSHKSILKGFTITRSTMLQGRLCLSSAVEFFCRPNISLSSYRSYYYLPKNVHSSSVCKRKLFRVHFFSYHGITVWFRSNEDVQYFLATLEFDKCPNNETQDTFLLLAVFNHWGRALGACGGLN